MKTLQIRVQEVEAKAPRSNTVVQRAHADEILRMIEEPAETEAELCAEGAVSQECNKEQGRTSVLSQGP